MPEFTTRQYENLTVYEFLIEQARKPFPDRIAALAVSHNPKITYPEAEYRSIPFLAKRVIPEGNPIFKLKVIDIPPASYHLLEFFSQRKTENTEGEWLSLVVQDSFPFGVFSINSEDLESITKAYEEAHQIDRNKLKQRIENIDSLKHISPGSLFGFCLEQRPGR